MEMRGEKPSALILLTARTPLSLASPEECRLLGRVALIPKTEPLAKALPLRRVE